MGSDRPRTGRQAAGEAERIGRTSDADGHAASLTERAAPLVSQICLAAKLWRHMAAWRHGERLFGQVTRELQRAVCRGLHVKQFGDTERALTEALALVFRAQVVSASNRLRGITPRSFTLRTKSAADQAEVLAALVFDPDEWHGKVVDAALPVLAAAMGDAAVAQLLQMGIEPRKAPRLWGEKRTETEVRPSTASEWLAAEGLGPPPGVATELPSWMKDAIEVQLRDTFSQPYWRKISETTGGDIERFLLSGIQEGMSVEDMARKMRDAFPGEYSLRRGRLIARTESGHALNSGRRLSMDRLAEEIPGLPMRPEWLSVLGNTTRDSHASLDGVPADDDGLFNLDGIRIPWPSHVSLPVNNRANCQCTLVHGFGTSDEEAQRLIAEHEERLE